MSRYTVYVWSVFFMFPSFWYPTRHQIKPSESSNASAAKNLVAFACLRSLHVISYHTSHPPLSAHATASRLREVILIASKQYANCLAKRINVNHPAPTSHASWESVRHGLVVVAGRDVVAQRGLLPRASDRHHVALVLRADERLGLHARHVRRVGARQPAGKSR